MWREFSASVPSPTPTCTCMHRLLIPEISNRQSAWLLFAWHWCSYCSCLPSVTAVEVSSAASFTELHHSFCHLQKLWYGPGNEAKHKVPHCWLVLRLPYSFQVYLRACVSAIVHRSESSKPGWLLISEIWTCTCKLVWFHYRILSLEQLLSPKHPV